MWWGWGSRAGCGVSGLVSLTFDVTSEVLLIVPGSEAVKDWKMFFHTTLIFTITVSTERGHKLIFFLTHKCLQIARLLHPPPLLVEGVCLLDVNMKVPRYCYCGHLFICRGS